MQPGAAARGLFYWDLVFSQEYISNERLADFFQSPFSFAEESDLQFESVRSAGAGRTARAERQVRLGRTEARPTAMGRGFMGVERSSVTLNLCETAC